MAGMNMRLDNELKHIDARLRDPKTTPEMRQALEAAKRSILAAYDPDDNSVERRPRR
jgi:hypothetical protein